MVDSFKRGEGEHLVESGLKEFADHRGLGEMHCKHFRASGTLDRTTDDAFLFDICCWKVLNTNEIISHSERNTQADRRLAGGNNLNNPEN